MKRAITMALMLLMPVAAMACTPGPPKEPDPAGVSYPGPDGLVGALNVSREVTLQNAAVATGNGTSLPMSGSDSAVLQVNGITTATITFEGTVDGSNWVAVAMSDLNSTTRARATTATADGLYLLESAGSLTLLRARVSVWTAGTITVKGSSN